MHILVLHTQSSQLVTILRDTLRLLESNLTLSSGTRDLSDLPPASLQRFLRARKDLDGGLSNFKGYVLATYNQNFTNRYIFRQFTRAKSKSGAVVNHQRMFVVLKTTSNTK